MKRVEEHRLSCVRRAELFLRFMDETFPTDAGNGIPWHHCIDLTTMRIENVHTCPIAQVVGVAGGDYYSACKRAGIALNQRKLQHAGVLLYNLTKHNRKWTVDYAAREAETLNRLISEKIRQRYEEHPKRNT